MTLRFRRINILAWLAWMLVCLVCIAAPVFAAGSDDFSGLPTLSGVITHDSDGGSPVPWQPVHRSRRWLWRESLRQFRRVACLLAGR